MTDDEAARAYHGAGMRQSMSAIELAGCVKAKYDERWIIENVRRIVMNLVFGALKPSVPPHVQPKVAIP